MFDRNMMRLKGMKGIMLGLVVLALLQASAIAGQAWTLSRAVSALWAGQTVASQAATIAAFFACFAIRRLASFAQDCMLDWYARARADELHGMLLDTAFDRRSKAAQRIGSAVLATTATEGIDDVHEYLRIIPPKVVGIAAISVPILAVEWAIDWPSGVILTVMLPVTVFFMVLLGRQARSRAERQYAAYNRLSNHFLDTLRGMGTIVAAGFVRGAQRDVYSTSETLRKATIRTLTTATLSSAVLDLCATFGVAAVAMMLAFRLMDGSVDLATGLAALILAPDYFAPIRSFASDFHASLDGKNALKAVLDILDGAERAREVPNDRESAMPDGMDIVFDHVSFSYGDSAVAALDDISLSIAHGEHVAVIGQSGSGKSTLAALAASFLQPTGGTVRVRGNVCFVPQNPYIFHMSLADNVSFYNPLASRDDIQRAIALVGLGPLVDELPDGMDSVVGSGGRGLSGGEAHRIALARLLLVDEDCILVFDEPTAHLDIETELELKERLLPILAGRTVLFATHRLHWTGDMDRTIALEGGAIVRGAGGDRP